MLVQIHLNAAKMNLEAGNKDRAGEILRQALTIPDLIKQQVAGLSDFGIRLYKGSMLTVTDNMKKGLDKDKSILRLIFTPDYNQDGVFFYKVSVGLTYCFFEAKDI